jgi:dihydroorotase
MKYILIKNATVIDTNSEHHLKKTDLLIESGVIKTIAKNIEQIVGETEIIDAEDLYVSIGWMDLRVNFNDPGT